ncbi:hypothetical protein, partial [Xanthomonas hortorum]
MPTTVKQIPGFRAIASGNNIVVQAGNPTQYFVSHIAPYPNRDLVVGNTYSISDPNYPPGIVVELVHVSTPRKIDPSITRGL